MASTRKATREPDAVDPPPSGRRDGAALTRDPGVHLGATVAVEVEQRARVALAPVEVARRHDEFVSGGICLRDDLPRWGDDHALRQRVHTGFHAALRHTDDPGAV